MKFLIVFMFLFSCCGKSPKSSERKLLDDIDGVFWGHVKAFEKLIESKGHKRDTPLTIKFGRVNGGKAAVCIVKEYKHFRSRARLTIIVERWAWDDIRVREPLMFHELGHCVLGLGHSDDKNSLMYPIIDVRRYHQNRAVFLDSLFKKGQL